MLIHVQKFTKSCKYFKGNVICPFEELGCKFRHEEYKKDIFEEKDDMNTDEIQSLVDSSSCDKESESSFHTSTPKSGKCEECMDRSECADCIVRQVLGKQGGIK